MRRQEHESTETSTEVSEKYGLKRSWNAQDGPGSNFGKENVVSDADTPSRSRKRQRTSGAAACVNQRGEKRTVRMSESCRSMGDKMRKHEYEPFDSHPDHFMKAMHEVQPTDQKKANGKTGKPSNSDTEAVNVDGEDRAMGTKYIGEHTQEASNTTGSQGRKRTRKGSLGSSGGEADRDLSASAKRQRLENAEEREQQHCSDPESPGEESDTGEIQKMCWVFPEGHERPRFYGASQSIKNTGEVEWVPENHVVGDLVVAFVSYANQEKDELPSCADYIQPYRNRPWTDQETEAVRSWVQDYDIQKWAPIAECLHRPEHQCRNQYRRIIMLLNRSAGRGVLAGLPEWSDPELEPLSEEVAQKVSEDAAGQVRAINEKVAREKGVATSTKKCTEEHDTSAHQSIKVDGNPQKDQEAAVGDDLEGDQFGLEVPVSRGERSTANDSTEPEGPPSSRLRLRPPRSTNNRLGSCGRIFYDPKARSFTRKTSMQAFVKSKGSSSDKEYKA